MKKYLFFTVLLFLFAINGAVADNINNLIQKYASLPDVDLLYVDSTEMKPGQSFDWLDRIPIQGNIDSLVITDLSKCSPEIQLNFQKDFQSYIDEVNYQTVLNIDEQGDILRMISRRKDGLINEIYIFLRNETQQAVIVKITGQFEPIDPMLLKK